VEDMRFDEDGDKTIDDFDIKCMANLIGKPLSDGQFNYYRGRRQPTSKHACRPVERICGPDGSIVHPVKNVGDKVRVWQQSCFICRQYRRLKIPSGNVRIVVCPCAMLTGVMVGRGSCVA